MHTVAYVVSSLKRCGPNNQLLGIIKHLDRSKFRPIIVTCGPEPDDSMSQSFTDAELCPIITYPGGRLSWQLSGPQWLRRTLTDNHVDIVHSQNLRPDIAISSSWAGKPWVSTLRNYPYEDYSMQYGMIVGSLLARQHMLASSKCKHLIACGKTISELYRSHSIPSDVVYNGVDFERFPLARSKTVHPGEGHRLIFTGNLIRRKRVDRVISLFLSMQAAGFANGLTIVGDGPLRGPLQSRSDPAIQFTGNVTNVMPHLHESSLFVMLSESEGIPNSALEALACGLPCILSNIPQHREIHTAMPDYVLLVNGDDKRLIENNAFKATLADWRSSDPAEIRNLAMRRFDIRITSKLYSEHYISALAKST